MPTGKTDIKGQTELTSSDEISGKLQQILHAEDMAIQAADRDRVIRKISAKDGGNGRPFIASSNHLHVAMLDRLLARPDRKRLSVSMTDVDSFIEYVNMMKEPTTVIFASVLEAPYRFTAAIDFHGADADGASWVTHQVELQLTQTPEWKAWKDRDRDAMTQQEFALFLEDHQPEIVKPERTGTRENWRTT